MDEGEYLWTSNKLSPRYEELFHPWLLRLPVLASKDAWGARSWEGDPPPSLLARWEREVAACSNPGKGRELMRRVLAGEVNTPERLTSMIPDRDAQEVWAFMRLIQFSGGVHSNWGMDWPDGRTQGEWADVLWGDLRSALASKDWAAYHHLARTYDRVARVPGWDWREQAEAMMAYKDQTLEDWFRHGGGLPSPSDPYGFCGSSNPALRYERGCHPTPRTPEELLDCATFQWSTLSHNGWFAGETTEAVLFTLKVLWRMKWGWDVQVFATEPESEYPRWQIRVNFGDPQNPQTLWSSRSSPVWFDQLARQGAVLMEHPVTPHLPVGVNVRPESRFFVGRDAEQHRKAREDQLREWGWLHPSSAP
jgi:hypothetical protein